jgi:hypothetical protein
VELTPIVELGVDEAYTILTERFAQSDLPPLDAIENEDWGRDFLLSRFESIPIETLASVGLSRDKGWDQRGLELGPQIGNVRPEISNQKSQIGNVRSETTELSTSTPPGPDHSGRG